MVPGSNPGGPTTSHIVTTNAILNARAAVLAVLATVVIVWQVPHTIVLRYALLIGLGALSWPLAFARLARPRAPIERRARAPFAWLAAFLAWSLVVALVVSPTPWQSVTDLRAEWLAPALIIVLGYGIALRYGDEDIALRIVFLALVLHAFMQLVSAALLLASGQTINFLNFGGISDHKANVTYTNALALALLVADALARVAGHRGFLRIDTRWTLAAFALLLASTILATTRNGLIVFGLLAGVGFVLIGWQLRGRATPAAWAVLGACALAVVIGAAAGLKADPRWERFMGTAVVAWDTDGHRQWLQGEGNESNLPQTARGRRVDPSAYYRIAYLREGLRLIADHPWGTRVGRDSFPRGINAKYGAGGMSHAHSGFLDLGVSVGLPGVALWAAFLASLVTFAVRAKGAAGSGLRLALGLVVAVFAARSLVDATMRDHILQEFMLVAGMLMGALVAAEARARG